ncbi:uncharacterized protein FOMMEDRAFT_155219 [Fomitiporia mediterranea MF3/22]|uniref:uncharacterized protein n=1 Tax=Fomitiporia mediterranea (strain MF3/22) TaxID=694068 RepID=UPI00044082C8|nr:uncharacterized protein FOMMEDRAFT_155219 [Fomitiporia mediterranea MF3/22]EJD04085.1 hypothetical protein FOMMEDRAFT_155219 [Fomitiporia mediterranea MF3/22]
MDANAEVRTRGVKATVKSAGRGRDMRHRKYSNKVHIRTRVAEWSWVFNDRQLTQLFLSPLFFPAISLHANRSASSVATLAHTRLQVPSDTDRCQIPRRWARKRQAKTRQRSPRLQSTALYHCVLVPFRSAYMYSSSAKAYRPHHSSRPSNHRARSSSDPFSDPIYPAPTVAYSRSDAPPPPPKQQQYKKSTRQYTDSRDPRMLESAVRDTVTVRPVDTPSRTRMGRSQTGGVPTNVGGSRHAPPPTRRSYSQDSATRAAAAMEKSRKAGAKNKKGSTHADVIDRLDFTGVGPMFHHDGPFDACAPSRNRHKSKAPMMAWTSPEDDGPMSAAQLRADRKRGLPDVAGLRESPYPTFGADTDPYGTQKNAKQVDRIAEAWGMHEPEPYEEFFGSGAGHGTGDNSAASSIYGGYESHYHNARNRPQGRELRETYAEDAQPRKAKVRVPPPQPLNLPGTGRSTSLDAPSNSLPSPPLTGSPGAPKRSKSLMQRIKKMRDQPNVPVEAVQGDGNQSPPSSSENYPPGGYSDGGRPSRPTHRQQNSFFGRFGGRNASANAGATSPSPDMNESYVYVERSTNNKALPPRPAETPITPLNGHEKDGYFDGPHSPGGTPMSPGNGLGRKTSLLKRVRGAVRVGGK